MYEGLTSLVGLPEVTPGGQICVTAAEGWLRSPQIGAHPRRGWGEGSPQAQGAGHGALGWGSRREGRGRAQPPPCSPGCLLPAQPALASPAPRQPRHSAHTGLGKFRGTAHSRPSPPHPVFSYPMPSAATAVWPRGPLGPGRWVICAHPTGCAV